MTVNIEKDVVNQYLLNINVPRDSSLPLEVYIAFPKTLNDHAIRDQVKTQWLNGNDKQYVSMQLMFSKSVTCIFRPTGVLLDWKTMTIGVYTPSGLMIIIPNSFLKELGITHEQQIENLNDYLYVTCERWEDSLVATACVPLRGKIETDVAKEILEKTQLTPLELILTGLGYQPTPHVKRLFTPRLITWFKGFDGKPMHVSQFTLPETAKTHFGIRNETLFNWRYIPEPPTLARLILDARQGILGEVFLRNGIVFDEFDKWDLGNTDRRMTFDAILTGMEQGKWVRGVSSLGVRPPDVTRLLPILFFGNLGDFAKIYGVIPLCTRAWFTEIYSRRLTHDVSALADRIAIIDACFIKIPVMDYLTYKVLPDSIMRGIVTHLQSQVKPQSISTLKGRLKRHSDNLYAILNTFVKVDPQTSDNMVAGIYEWDKNVPIVITKTIPTIERDETPQKTLVPTPQPLGHLDLMHAILDVVETAQKTVPEVEKAYILQVVNKKYGTTAEDFRNALQELIKEGMLYEPKDGYVKKT